MNNLLDTYNRLLEEGRVYDINLCNCTCGCHNRPAKENTKGCCGCRKCNECGRYIKESLVGLHKQHHMQISDLIEKEEERIKKAVHKAKERALKE